MVKAFDDPLITPTQLRMLSEGMSSNSDCDPIEIKSGGDSPPSSPSLSSPSSSSSSGSSPSDTIDSAPKVRLTPELVKGMEAGIGPFLGISMRLFTDDRHYEWMESFGSTRPQKGSSSTLPLSGFVLFTFLSVLVLSGTSMFESVFLGKQEGKEAGTIWWRLLAVNVVAIPTCFWALNRMGGDWVSLIRPSLKSTLQAIGEQNRRYVHSLLFHSSLTSFLPSLCPCLLYFQLGWDEISRNGSE
jgi:hypothetical protein